MYSKKSSHLNIFVLSVLIISCVVAYSESVVQASVLEKTFKAPSFPHTEASQWINSEPLTIEDLRGKVVLLDFWTFGCWNCYRSFPWLRAVEEKYQDQPFQVMGVHTPEFDNERIYENIVEKVKEFKLHHPTMIDNDYSYWRAMNNRYWPAFYLIDKKGIVRAVYIGETHKGDRRAKAIQKTIDELLMEKP